MANPNLNGTGKTTTTWKRIKVPDRAYYFIRERARARKLPMWQFITQAIDFYESAMSDKVVADKTKSQNASYYSVKLVMAVTDKVICTVWNLNPFPRSRGFTRTVQVWVCHFFHQDLGAHLSVSFCLLIPF